MHLKWSFEITVEFFGRNQLKVTEELGTITYCIERL